MRRATAALAKDAQPERWLAIGLSAMIPTLVTTDRGGAARIELQAGTPESFNVLIKEIQSLGLDIKLQKRDALSYGS